MRDARSVVTAALGIVWNMGIVVIVLAVLVAMSSKNWNDSFVDAPENTPQSIVSVSGADRARIALEVGEGKAYSHYILEDKEGKELLLVTYSRSGSLIVTLGEAFPIRPGYSATIDGFYNFVVANGGLDYRLKLRPGGSSGFTVSNRSEGLRDGLGVNVAGKLVHDPSVID
ncbi:hypothetical protein [Paludisphaera borealis]|uniref:Uncharacterized protein n=1 Tax=Paludisphaera borealis TaxID=1387353 RepID=A0A1U7CJP9_9BACT|nr:hypothetical protein [Paludisphaera borealis]APW59170.1 hypothetical protein BSF38_00584 [Paludisphaera borealis]